MITISNVTVSQSSDWSTVTSNHIPYTQTANSERFYTNFIDNYFENNKQFTRLYCNDQYRVNIPLEPGRNWVSDVPSLGLGHTMENNSNQQFIEENLFIPNYPPHTWQSPWYSSSLGWSLLHIEIFYILNIILKYFNSGPPATVWKL